MISLLCKYPALGALAERIRQMVARAGRQDPVIDVLQVNAYGASALHDAAFRGDLADVTRLLAAGAPVNARDKDGNTPLHMAAHAPTRPDVESVVRVLIERGADVHAQNELWATPLHNAVRKGRMGVCAMLLDAGANPNAAQMVGTSEFNDETDLINTFTPLHAAVGKRSLEACQLLVVRGASAAWMRPENAYRGYLTPFQHAVKNGPVEILHFFHHECGEALDQTTFAGQTMLELAAKGSEVEAYLLACRTEQTLMAVFDEMAPAEEGARIPRGSMIEPL